MNYNTYSAEQTKTANGQIRNKWQLVIEDAFITGVITFLSGLVVGGYPPSAEVCYFAGLNSILMGLYSWARLRNINVGKQ